MDLAAPEPTRPVRGPRGCSDPPFPEHGPIPGHGSRSPRAAAAGSRHLGSQETAFPGTPTPMPTFSPRAMNPRSPGPAVPGSTDPIFHGPDCSGRWIPTPLAPPFPEIDPGSPPRLSRSQSPVTEPSPAPSAGGNGSGERHGLGRVFRRLSRQRRGGPAGGFPAAPGRVTAPGQGLAGRGRPPGHPGATGLGQMTLPGPAPVNHGGTGGCSCRTGSAARPGAPGALHIPGHLTSQGHRRHRGAPGGPRLAAV